MSDNNKNLEINDKTMQFGFIIKRQNTICHCVFYRPIKIKKSYVRIEKVVYS